MEPINGHVDNPPAEIPKKRSVILLCLLSIITIGIYLYFWYIGRYPELNNLRTGAKLNGRLVIFALVLYIILIGAVTGLILTSGFEIEKITSMDFSQAQLSFKIIFPTIILLVIIEIIVMIFLPFKTRQILNQALANKGVKRNVSAFFTLIFNFLYLQYEINRIIDDKEMRKRTGPWVWFFILYLLPILIGTALLILVIFKIDILPTINN